MQKLFKNELSLNSSSLIREQEQLKKLSDDFGLFKNKQKKCIWSGIVDSD